MTHRSRKGFRADFVSARRRVRAARREFGARLARWAIQAREYGTRTSESVRGLIARCAAAATPALRLCPATERLEGRTLLSAVWLSNGVLNLAGDSNVANSLTV